MFGRFKNIHFVGIGGVGMSGIAEVLINLGLNVSGSDVRDSDYTEHLKIIGARIFIGHKAENIGNSDVIVWSTAITENNPELIEAKRKKIPIIRRAEMLAELMRLKKGIAIAGTHGKTTTTSLVSLILSKAELDPTIVIGGKFNNIGTGAKMGRGEYLVAEADESDGTFLKLFPTYCAVTNIDTDHLDYYGSIEVIKKTFVKFIQKLPFFGVAALCYDDENIRSILPEINKRYITYGVNENADVVAEDYYVEGLTSFFNVNYRGKKLGKIKLTVPGKHNVLNALAAICLAMELGVDFEVIKSTLLEYRGVQRRFQIKNNVNDILVIDDYAHHPTELKATLNAAHNK
jgi:UDP-N-acetylmuramate--alanine ligase